jgi:putative heme-binding domain-containing protein
VPALLARARQLVTTADDKSALLAVAASAMLARGLDDSDAADVELLTNATSPQKPPELRTAAVTALARTGRGDVPKLLLAGWAAHSPTLRSQILDALAAREEWSLALLAAVESGQVPQSQLDARRRQQFLTARSKAVRERAEKVLAGAVDANRQKLVETYLAAATASTGRAGEGKVAFAKRCANCHKLSGEGHAVGPDLGPLTHRAAEYLLTAILDPNRAVEDRYLEYVALTTDGRQLTGILLEETGASLTLAAPEGKQMVISRGELEQIKAAAVADAGESNATCPRRR